MSADLLEQMRQSSRRLAYPGYRNALSPIRPVVPCRKVIALHRQTSVSRRDFDDSRAPPIKPVYIRKLVRYIEGHGEQE
jgi:hypothetical protein